MDILRVKQRRQSARRISFDPQSVQEHSVSGNMAVINQLVDPQPGPAQLVDYNEQEEIVVLSIQRLPDSQRTVLVLHDIEGFSYQEIADIMGTNIGTVRSRLHYGRIKLRELLEPYFSFQKVHAVSR
jgi:RNA polymerase sigma factor (sigma-70 family)